MEELKHLYQEWSGAAPAKMERLPGAGSNRIYYRMTDEKGSSVIGCIGTSRDENHAFVTLTRHFTKRQLPVPQILAVSNDELRYLQTDLGTQSLYDVLQRGREAGGRYNQQERALLVKTIRELPNIQMRGARGLDWSCCYPQPEFDQDSVLFDLNYFKYCFLKATGLDFHELKLEANFRMLAKDLTAEACDAFLYRDFQARNVMIVDQAPLLSPEGDTNAQTNEAPSGAVGGAYSILLDHQPHHLDQTAEAGIDFQFSGHTHRGQVWPISWITDRIYECSWGAHQIGQTQFYVTSGIGIWGGKYRIGTQSEYVVLTLR